MYYMIWIASRDRILDTDRVGWRGTAIAQTDSFDELWMAVPVARRAAQQMAANVGSIVRLRCERLGSVVVPLHDEYFEP